MDRPSKQLVRRKSCADVGLIHVPRAIIFPEKYYILVCFLCFPEIFLACSSSTFSLLKSVSNMYALFRHPCFLLQNKFKSPQVSSM